MLQNPRDSWLFCLCSPRLFHLCSPRLFHLCSPRLFHLCSPCRSAMPMVRAAQNNVACTLLQLLCCFVHSMGSTLQLATDGEHKERTNFELSVSSLHTDSLLLTLWICLHCLNPSPGYGKQKKTLFLIHNMNSVLNWPSFQFELIRIKLATPH